MHRYAILIVTFNLVIFVLLGSVSFANAEEYDQNMGQPERYQYIDNISTTLSVGAGKANATLRVRDMNGHTTRIICNMYLQKYSTGSWSNVCKWSKTTTSNTLLLAQTRAISTGKYRVKSVIKAYKGERKETIVDYSGIKTY